MERSNTILIIDDDQRNIFALSAVLKSRGFECTGVPGMEEAFSILSELKNTGLILMDMMMPGMDGYEGIASLKGNKGTSAIPVIAVTAQAMPGDREKCPAAGADDYITKPVDLDQLLNLLQEHLI